MKPFATLALLAALRAQVEQCSQSLNLKLFPDEVNSIAAVLNSDYYHFK